MTDSTFIQFADENGPQEREFKRSPDGSWNFINRMFRIDDSELFNPSDLLNTIPENWGWTMAHIMVAVGLFPSSSQARKNGWDKPIPEGWTELKVGKQKLPVFIWNPVE